MVILIVLYVRNNIDHIGKKVYNMHYYILNNIFNKHDWIIKLHPNT